MLALLAIHAGLALWGAAKNSVTFDENFHVPAGAFIAARGDLEVSIAQPAAGEDYLGGMPGHESDWIAVSSYYFVGLTQRMMTQQGRTERLKLDFGPLRNWKPDAVVAGCMYLFRLR